MYYVGIHWEMFTMHRALYAFFAFILAIAAASSALADVSQTLLTVLPGRVPYTSEKQGQLLVTPSDQLNGKTLSVHVQYQGKDVASECSATAGVRAIVPLSLDTFAQGQNEITCRLMADGQEVAAATVTLTKLDPKPNEVKIDNITNSMIVDDHPFLPFGFYCDGSFGTLAEEESLNGFNMISPYWSKKTKRTPEEISDLRDKLDRCAAVGIRVNYHIESACMRLDGQAQEDAIRAEVEAFRDHPALLSWYIADEPEGNGVTPERLQAAYKLIKALDPYHPIGVCMVGLSAMPKFAPSMDFLMPDAYPVPHQPLTMVGDWVDRGRRGMDYSKPVWFIPQVFGGGEYWYREPTANEVRVMTYLTMIHGATGVQYFVRRPPIGNPGSPVVWSECRTLAMEISQLAPAILSQEPAPKVTCDQPQIESRAFLDRGMLFLIAANTKNEPTTMQLKIDCGYSGKANAIFDRRQVDVRQGALTDMIDGYATRVYQLALTPAPKDDIDIDPDNIVANPSFEEIVSAGSVANCYGSRGDAPYANVSLDPFVARHGRQSVRMTAQSIDQSIGLTPLLLKDPQTKTTELSNKPWPFWFTYTPDEQLKISIWAKAKDPGLTLRISDPFLSGLRKEFQLTADWQRYEVTATETKKKSYSSLSFSLVGKGTAWFDLFQVVRVKPQQ